MPGPVRAAHIVRELHEGSPAARLTRARRTGPYVRLAHMLFNLTIVACCVSAVVTKTAAAFCPDATRRARLLGSVPGDTWCPTRRARAAALPPAESPLCHRPSAFWTEGNRSDRPHCLRDRAGGKWTSQSLSMPPASMDMLSVQLKHKHISAYHATRTLKNHVTLTPPESPCTYEQHQGTNRFQIDTV